MTRFTGRAFMVDQVGAGADGVLAQLKLNAAALEEKMQAMSSYLCGQGLLGVRPSPP
ncbi:hypothetical protein [Streptomyces sp. NPDC055039]